MILRQRLGITDALTTARFRIMEEEHGERTDLLGGRLMGLTGVKILEHDGHPLLLVSRAQYVDIADLHPYLTRRGYVLREGPRPEDMEDDELGVCEAFWLRRFESVR